ncbi:MAG TPA: haloacid dehalogenase-like hydrolase, partial [Kofleriaceae bacterium]|nr:haloacid dehalogenase-like hydrolase [Kofleriaceae bacterium]
MAGERELAVTPEPETFPLCVDLDGTLVRTDTLHEQYLTALVRRPLAALLVLLQLLRGKAAFKRGLSRISRIDPTALPYQSDFVEFLRAEKARGRMLVFVTASDHEVATTIAAHLAIFDEVMGSDGTTNLKSQAKAERLVARFGRGKFSYAGNSHADLPVWSEAGEIILVNTPRSIDAKLASSTIAHRFGNAATP